MVLVLHRYVSYGLNIFNDNRCAGTTCATVLTRAIFTEGCKSVAAGMNAMDLRRGISMAVDAVVTSLKSRARMISTSEEIAQVCILFSAKKKKSTTFCQVMLGVEVIFTL